MKVLITGGAGFIGSHIAEHYQGIADEIRVLDNLRTGYKKNLDGLNVTFIEGSITDRDLVAKAVEDVDYIFHMAAMVSVPESMQKPRETVDLNVNGLLTVLEEASKAGVKKVVLASSAAIYGDNPIVPKVETMYPEPKSPYGITKLDGEYYMEMFRTTGQVNTGCCRFFNVFGPRQDPDGAYAAVIPKFIASLLARKSPVINGDGSFSRDFTYVDNAVEANILAASAESAACSQMYNIACGSELDLNGLFTELQKQLALNDPAILDVFPEYGEKRPGDIPHSLADISKAEKYLGYQVKVPVSEGLKRTCIWYSGKELV